MNRAVLIIWAIVFILDMGTIYNQRKQIALLNSQLEQYCNQGGAR